MIVTETQDGFTRTWSDAGFYIYGGNPEGYYTVATDPEGSGRTYVETDRKIPEDEEEAESVTLEDAMNALKELGVK